MDEVFKDEIRSRLLLEHGVKLSGDDPIFSYFIGQQVVLDRFTLPIVEAMQRLPGELEKSLSKVVFAVEEAERTAETLMHETKGALSALGKFEVEAAQERLKGSVEASVSELLTTALQRANSDITQVERQAKALSNGLRDTKTSRLNMVLAIALIGLMGLFSIGLFLLYSAGSKNQEAANYWFDRYSGQQEALKSLAPGVKKLLPNKLLAE
ncbi:putative Zn-dependent protease with MMP-like domain [Pseudomonas sp. BIGb0381]|uniref:hypothetical protein n=1 Tax=Pseudomonas TaxID=286 RepID=UPI002167A579|nr:hypothetical protein [Pseudomonas sp. BIGb0381]MCS4315598.1 putative Zn-dependent protease with MMP-like domain [Pseudomonas sp. BIGb0381]